MVFLSVEIAFRLSRPSLSESCSLSDWVATLVENLCENQEI